MNWPRGIFLSLGLLSACTGRDAQPPVAATEAAASRQADSSGIAWFKGDVDAAFAAAAREHKPVFLYWGASWCPPCHQLKATVFSRPDFIARTKLFVPVYIDGDVPGAQKWGEQFRVTGYPTLVVLNERREELLRIAGGMDLSQYAQVLDLALGDLQPVNAIFDAALAGRALSGADCRRLAYNAWVLDDVDSPQRSPLARNLDAAAAHCPADAKLERTRLGLLAVYFESEAEATQLAADQPPSAALRARVAWLTSLLADPARLAGNADALGFLGKPLFLAVKAGGAAAEVDRFLGQYSAVMQTVEKNPNFAAADRLGAYGSRMEATKLLTGAIPPAMATEAWATVQSALATQYIAYERSSVINAVLPIYELLGRNEEAYRQLLAELPKSQYPYYLKLDLADFAEKLGRRDVALDWYRQAYEESRGAATRFQWGTIYLGGLLRLTPDDTVTITRVSTQLISELDGDNRIYRRVRTRLVTLDQRLTDWQAGAPAQRAPVLRALRGRLQQTCLKIPAAEPARASCDAFLAGSA